MAHLKNKIHNLEANLRRYSMQLKNLDYCKDMSSRRSRKLFSNETNINFLIFESATDKKIILVVGRYAL